jgi:hypothetical protein
VQSRSVIAVNSRSLTSVAPFVQDSKVGTLVVLTERQRALLDERELTVGRLEASLRTAQASGQDAQVGRSVRRTCLGTC